jgi:hypothetical protein
MKFMCQVWHDGGLIDAMPPEEKQALDRANLAADAELKRRGHLVLAQALQSPKTAVTVRVRDGRVSATDGPFIETKEHLGGFILIEATDIDEAVRLMAGDPMAQSGSIEIRPVMARTVTDGAYDYDVPQSPNRRS